MATITTPVRKTTEISNESPLPTPPQAMHDLIRNGRGRPSTQHMEANEDDIHAPGSQGALPPSPSAKSAQKRPTHRPGQGSLALSMGATSSASNHHNRNALGSQLGIAAESAGRPYLASKRSTSYESQDKLSRRPSLRLSDKENVESVKGPLHKSAIQLRKSSSNQTSPSSSPPIAAESVFNKSIHRRTSAGKGESLELLRRSSDEGAGSSSRAHRAPLKELHGTHEEDDQHNTTTAGGVHFQTPALGSSSRGLRSAQSKQNGAPWSVGRSIKRIDRHHGPDKPPQRIVAHQEDEDEDYEEDPYEQSNVGDPQASASRSDSGSHHESQHVVSRHNSRTALSQSEGSGGERPSVPQVTLGADEDEEEEDFYQGQQGTGVVIRDARKTAKEVDQLPHQRRKAAINDILAAKVPHTADPRRVSALGSFPENNGAASAPSARQWPYDGMSLSGDSAAYDAMQAPLDFMTMVRQEAHRQRGVPFIDQLSLRPSKDLETKFNGFKFKKVRKAGEGGFSTVWIVRGPFAAPDASSAGGFVDIPDKEQAYFAMKQVTLKKMEKVSRDEVLEECNMLQSLASKRNNEDFILRFFGWKSSTGSLKILMELGEHDFSHILRSQRLTRDQIATNWYQMLQAVHFTHEEGNIVHTDLKPANFLMANSRLKLIDFGIAQKIPVGTIHIKRDAMIGTPNYMAPETVRAVKEARGSRSVLSAMSSGGAESTARVYKAGKASDVWALGCILYQMVYNHPPFDAFHGDDKLREILDSKHRIAFPDTRYGPSTGKEHDIHEDEEDEGTLEEVGDDLLDVMRLTLTYQASERITIPQLFRHPFLRSFRQSHGEEASEEEESIPMSRGMLKDVLRKMYTYAMNGELRDDNIDARSDALFDNMRKRLAQQ